MNYNKKGIAMIIVVSLILMLLLLGGGVLVLSTSHFSTSFHNIKRIRAYYAAEAALQRVLWQLRTGKITPPALGAGPLLVAFPEDINGISASNIVIKVGDQNQTGENPEGVYPVMVTVTY